MGISRLRRECAAIMKNPIENIDAVPLETNVHEWHYCIKGVKGSSVSTRSSSSSQIWQQPGFRTSRRRAPRLLGIEKMARMIAVQ
jgi:hypothetical protein